jgi:hypothetical protein
MPLLHGWAHSGYTKRDALEVILVRDQDRQQLYHHSKRFRTVAEAGLRICRGKLVDLHLHADISQRCLYPDRRHTANQ